MRSVALLPILAMLFATSTAKAQCDSTPGFFPLVEDLRLVFDAGDAAAQDGRIWTMRMGSCSSNLDHVHDDPRTILYVNGAATSPERFCETLATLRAITGRPVAGIYNASSGIVTDLRQARSDITLARSRWFGVRMDDPRMRRLVSRNPSVDQVASWIYGRIVNGLPAEVWAHSQGAVITAGALTDAQSNLRYHNRDLRSVRIVTFGAPVVHWLEGPSYEHWQHRRDPVPVIGAGLVMPSRTELRVIGWFGFPTLAKHDVYGYFRAWHRSRRPT